MAQTQKTTPARSRRKPLAAYWSPWGSIGTGSVNLTGSAHLFVVEYDDGTAFRIVADCGIFQGPGSDAANRGSFPLEPSSIHLAILSHGHADHCGRLPVFVKNGFSGDIWTTEKTAKVAKASLEDAAKLALLQFQAEQAGYEKKALALKKALKLVKASRARGVKRKPGGDRVSQSDESTRPTQQEIRDAERLLGEYQEVDEATGDTVTFGPERPTEPLFLAEDVAKTVAKFHSQPQNTWLPVSGAPGLSVMFFNAAHVLGSSSVAFRVHGIGTSKRQSKTFVFSGDVGPRREFAPHGIAEIPKEVHPDLIAVECTYGGRRHPDWYQTVQRFGELVTEASRKRDILVLPAFALDRAQVLLHLLVTLKQKGAFKGDIFLDSPLATTYTKMYQKDVPAYADSLRPGSKTFRIIEKDGREGFLDKKGFKIVVTSSGMGQGGPVGEYFRRYLENARAEFIFAGYMAEGTPGRTLVSGEKLVTIPGIGEFEVRAKVSQFYGMSSHADEAMIREWCGVGNPSGTGRPKSKFGNVRIALIHGETKTSIPAMKHAFGRRLYPEERILTPQVGDKVYL